MSLFFRKPCPGMGNCKSEFQTLKTHECWESRRWVQLLCKNWYKKWYLHFHKTYDHQIWQASTSREVKSNETDAADDVIMSKLKTRDKLKTYLHHQSVYGQKTWQDANLPWWAPDHKVIWLFSHMVLWDHVTNVDES